MGFIFKICFWFLFVVFIWDFLTRKYVNPYKLYMVVGKKGSGKTTMLVRLAYQHLRAGWSVYSTENIPGTFKIEYSDIGKFNIPSGSLLLVDEVGMVWDARKYKDFPDHLRDWFKYQRHEGVKVFLFSQTFDVDKKIRDLTDNMYLVTNKARIFAYAKQIKKVPDLIKPSAEAPARLDDVLQFESIIWFWCGSRMLTFIPRYAKLFDSHERLGLPEKDFDYIEPLNVPRSLLKPKKIRGKRYKSSKRYKQLILLRSRCRAFCVHCWDSIKHFFRTFPPAAAQAFRSWFGKFLYNDDLWD